MSGVASMITQVQDDRESSNNNNNSNANTTNNGPQSLIYSVQRNDGGGGAGVPPASNTNAMQNVARLNDGSGGTPTIGASSNSSNNNSNSNNNGKDDASTGSANGSTGGGGGKKFFSFLFCGCFTADENVPSDVSSRGRAAAASDSPLLPPSLPADRNKKCLVLDLDETLVHSSFKPMPNADFIIPVEIDNQLHHVYVAKRPGVDAFLKRMGDLFEIVVFTASLAKYADPVLDLLDTHRVVRYRLFREACSSHMGNYVKDLGRLGRKLAWTIIIDNSPTSYIFHPENAVPIGSWFDDPHDTELLDLIPFLEAVTQVDDVCQILDNP